MEYDIQEIRRVAQQIGNAAKGLSDISSDDLSRIHADIPMRLCGETADALAEVVSDIVSDTRKLISNLEQVSQELYAFAQRLKEADDKVKQHFANK